MVSIVEASDQLPRHHVSRVAHRVLATGAWDIEFAQLRLGLKLAQPVRHNLAILLVHALELLPVYLLMTSLDGDRFYVFEKVVFRASIKNGGANDVEQQLVDFGGAGTTQFVPDFSNVRQFTHLFVSRPGVKK